MGILDDAIREHLDLKRRLGVDQDEIRKLEDEAFGPPARPGDPDFPEQPQDEGDELNGRGFEAGSDGGDRPSATAEAPPTDAPFDLLDEEPPPPPPPPPSAETAPVEEVEDAPPPVDEPPALEDEPGSDLDLELDLDIEEEVDEVIEAPDEALPTGDEALPTGDEEPLRGEVAPSAAPEEPIESLDTVEHHFEGAIDEAEVVEGEIPDRAETSDSDEDEEADEDVLEETPEFLRDTPEDDELWFEQGEPKDFDF